MAIRVAFFDCDGTLTKVKSSWEYLHRRLNLWEGRADEYQRLFRSGTIDYHEFCRRDAALWRGLPVDRVTALADEIPYQPGAGQCMEGLRGLGVYVVILSTGLSFVVDRAKKDLSCDLALSNELLARQGLLTGEIRIRVPYDQKGAIVRDILGRLGVSPGEALAVGDGEGDRGMFEAVGLPVGFQPHSSVVPLVTHVLSDGSLLPLVDLVRDYG